MNYLPTQEFQLTGFVTSIIVGIALSSAYDVLKLVFFVFTGKQKKFIHFRDILFSVICLFVTFIFLLVMCEGQELFYALGGELLGYAVCHFTIGKKIFEPLLKKISLVVQNRKQKRRKTQKNMKIFKKLSKKHLQNQKIEFMLRPINTNNHFLKL